MPAKSMLDREFGQQELMGKKGRVPFYAKENAQPVWRSVGLVCCCMCVKMGKGPILNGGVF